VRPPMGAGDALTHACKPAHRPPYVLARISGQSMAETIAKSNARQLIKVDRGCCNLLLRLACAASAEHTIDELVEVERLRCRGPANRMKQS
jgi:hypothetical protein